MRNIEEFIGENKVFDGRYKLMRPLSTDGATADVWLAIDLNTIDTEYDEEDSSMHNKEDGTGMLVAIKIYRPKNALDIEGEQRFRDEYKIVYECRHENLLQPTSFAIYNGIPYLVLPYCKNGSSEQLIGKKQTEEEIWKFILDVSSGLAKLHSNQPQIIHQDIKPANILKDNNGNFAITDFGISSKTSGTHSSYYDDQNSGTFAYMAPERFEDNPSPTVESDIWAFGATLCEILTGKVPFGEEGGKSQKDDSLMPALPGLPASVKNLIHACLRKDPKKRPTAQQLVQVALKKQYPLKRKTPFFFMLSLLGCLLIAGAVYLFMKQPEPPMKKTAEEKFKIALRQMNIDNKDSLLAGKRVMDSLSNTEFVPAMYELAFTYGWYKDPVSVQRKHLLGIKTDTNGFPTENQDKMTTVALFSKILGKEDTLYANINAAASYRLFCYYGDPLFGKKKEKMIKKEAIDKDEAGFYLVQLEHWIKLSNDIIIIDLDTVIKTSHDSIGLKGDVIKNKKAYDKNKDID